MANWLPSTKRWRFLILCVLIMCFGMLLYFGGKYNGQNASDLSRLVLRRCLEWGLSSLPPDWLYVRNLFGGVSRQKLLFVPDADNQPDVDHEISEAALFRFLLNEEFRFRQQLDEAEAETTTMLRILKDIDKQSKIIEFETHQSSMGLATDWKEAFHVFIVFKTTCETEGVYYWWSLEKNSKYIVLQRSRKKDNVKDKLKGESRTKVKSIKEDLKGKGTMKDLFAILWAQQMIEEKYNILYSNCQSFVTFVGQQITELGYNYEGYFPYSPPPEKGRDKKMLELINVIRGYSDWPPLFHLIKIGNTDLVDEIVASGKYDINASCNGLTPLHLAIELEKTKMVKHLLKPPLNADPTKRDAYGKSALLLAANMYGMKEEIIDLLLEHKKVNVDDVDEDGQTALHLAASESNVKVFQKLIEKGANPNIFDKKGQSPLHAAALHGRTAEFIDLLLAHDKVNVDDVDENGETALHFAARGTNVDIFIKLLDNGANPNIFNKRGRSPLHLAVEKNRNEIIDLLLAHGKVMLDHADEDGKTALHLATWASSNVIFVQKLLKNGANPNVFNIWGYSPLHDAVEIKRNGNEIMDLLLANDKVNVDDVDENGQTALHWAASYSNVIAVQKLIEKGANPKITNKWGQSPLHLAAGRNELLALRQRRGQSDGNEIMDLLLAHSKVNVDDVDGKGQTALHIAAYKSNVNVVKYLVNKGANLNAVDKSDDSPLHVAAQERKGNPIIDLLLEAQKVKGMGDVNNRNKQGRTALHYAAAYSNEITAEHLINKGANVNCRTNVGDTPLDMAALGAKDMKIIDLLLNNINEGDIEQYRNDARLFLFAGHNVHGLGNKILDRLVEKGIQPPCTETDHCTGESDDESTGVNARRFEEEGADPPIDLTGFDGLDFLIARVKISLGIYDDINGRDPNGETPLLVAIRANYVNAVRNLLEKGADPTIRDERYGYTPFHVAVVYDTDFDILNLLLESGKVDINETTEYFGETALHMAIERSNKAAAKFLLSKGANPNVTTKYGRTPLHYAASRPKNMDIFELLLNHKNVDVNLINNDGRNALDIAMGNTFGHGERIANLLKEKGAVETEDKLLKRNNKSLQKLIIKNYISSSAADEIENVLSDATVPVEDKIARINEEHLISAIRDSDVESVRRLLKNGVDISSARGEYGMNALHVASNYAKTTDLIDVILETGKFDINGVDNEYGWTPLHWAIMGTNREINARHLIRKGADPTNADKEGDTPLHLAAKNAKEIETINLILENEQVDINSRGRNGQTALHRAIRYSNLITVRYLLKKGADLNVADEDGATPLHLAAKTQYYYENTELIDIILETGKCNINGVDNNGRTPLHYAIGRYYSPGTISALRLIEMGADPSIADNNGVTPLHMATKNAESMDLIEVLLNTEAVDVNCVDNEGRTALSYARDNKHGLDQSIIARLKEYGAKE